MKYWWVGMHTASSLVFTSLLIAYVFVEIFVGESSGSFVFFLLGINFYFVNLHYSAESVWVWVALQALYVVHYFFAYFSWSLFSHMKKQIAKTKGNRTGNRFCGRNWRCICLFFSALMNASIYFSGRLRSGETR